MRSDIMVNLTLPTSGILPQATGAVHSAAIYAILPDTEGKCGCVEGNKTRLMRGERTSEGRGVCNSVGRCSWRVLIAMSHQYQCRDVTGGLPTLP
jgi:hypothetical protein